MMKRLRGLWVFAGAAAVCAALYGLTLPEGLPWRVPLHWGGTWFVAALLAGGVGWLVSREFGERVGVAAAIAWIFMPGIWNRAILGSALVLLFPLAVLALWGAYWLVRDIGRQMTVGRSVPERRGAVGTPRPTILSRMIGWALLGLSVVFAGYSVYRHDYRLGEAASAYARGIVEDAGSRVIVLNRFVGKQIENSTVDLDLQPQPVKTLDPHRNDDKRYMLKVEAWARQEWPNEPDLAVAAGEDLFLFLSKALESHRERFYLMDGSSTTREAWERRWAAFVPYLASTDRFVPLGRRFFAYEGNAIANRLQDTDPEMAWKLYTRIAEEILPGNISARVNMSVMLSKGYPATDAERAAIERDIAAFLKDDTRRRYAREIAQASGPLRDVDELYERMEAAKRWATKVSEGVTADMPPDVRRTILMNNEMLSLAEAGDLASASVLARAILSMPLWFNWVPANAIMGDAMAMKGDYAASEIFYRRAMADPRKVVPMTWNGYADTLMHLDRLDEAEAIARQGMAKTDESFWPIRMTLAEILRKKDGDPAEIAALEKSVRAHVTPEDWKRLQERETPKTEEDHHEIH